MSNKFLGFLESVGKGFMHGLDFAVKEAPAVDALAAVIYPPSVAISAPVTAGMNLLRNTIMSVEQKYAASGVQNGTGTEKAAEVISIAGPATISLLNTAGVTNVDQGYVQNLISLLVAIMNIKAPATLPAIPTPAEPEPAAA